MSSSSLRTRPLIAAALLGATLILGACGFRPLYAQQGPRPGTPADLAAIEVKPIANRDGQMMHTALQRRLNVKYGAPALYHLTVGLTESLSTLAVEQNAFATRANLSVTASYQLVRIADDHKLSSGSARSVASYNILSSDYATLAAHADARKRAIEALADDIQARLAIYFSGPGVAASGPIRP